MDTNILTCSFVFGRALYTQHGSRCTKSIPFVFAGKCNDSFLVAFVSTIRHLGLMAVLIPDVGALPTNQDLP